MKILISGASGLVGSALGARLRADGHETTALSRRPDGGAIVWSPADGTIDNAGLEGHDAIVHLAGESIAAGRWNAALKKRILDSRVLGTRLLCSAAAELDAPPKTMICASAIGYYGSRGDELVDEESAPGEGFLADVCRAWEEETRVAEDAGIRVVHLRIGIVLSPDGGALKQMLTPFKLGLGGPVGDGRQFMSWISLDDLIDATRHALTQGDLSGPLNAVAPQPVTQREFASVLGRVLGRPAFMPLPGFAVRTLLGEMGDQLLLAGSRVSSARLEASGYEFQHPRLEEALRAVLQRAS